MRIEIVVARYNEDISWLYPYLDHDISIILYNKGQDIDKLDSRIKEIKLPNIGREANTYLYHIVHNYDNLKEITIFLQGRIDDHITIDKYEYINTMC